MSTPAAWAAVILSGGAARRLDGADKAALEHAGRSLLEHALAAVSGASEVVVVGPVTEVSRPVTFVREDPPGGGPLAGLAAGVAALGRDVSVVVVLAVDMPHVSVATVDRLLTALAAHPGAPGAWLVDGIGRHQLAGAVPRALVPPPGDAHGVPMRRLMDRSGSVGVPARERESEDVDTWADVARLRETPPRT